MKKEVQPVNKETTSDGKITIRVMPDKETLEMFLESLSGYMKAYFDTEKGEFIRLENKSNGSK